MAKDKEPIGTATLTADDGGPSAGIRTDGPCVRETIANLARGDRVKPLPTAALEVIRTQAADVLANIVEAYDTDVAQGEVGLNGSARAGTQSPSAWAPLTPLCATRSRHAVNAGENGFTKSLLRANNDPPMLSITALRESPIVRLTRPEPP